MINENKNKYSLDLIKKVMKERLDEILELCLKSIKFNDKEVDDWINQYEAKHKPIIDRYKSAMLKRRPKDDPKNINSFFFYSVLKISLTFLLQFLFFITTLLTKFHAVKCSVEWWS